MVTDATIFDGGRPVVVQRVVAAVGKAVSWLTLVMVLLMFLVVVMRYGFNLGWIWLQESVTYLHASVFMLVAAWALQDDAHVRVDIFYRESSPPRKAVVNLLGTLLLLVPFCLFLLIIAWEYVAASWRLLESSLEAGGVPAVYLLKSLILLLPALLLVQAVTGIERDIRLLRDPRRANAGD